MRYKQNKAQYYSSMYRGLSPKTKKLLVIGALVSVFIVTGLTIAAGFVVYKVGSIAVNAIKIENPNFEIKDLNTLLATALTLQSDIQNKLISKECRTSLNTHLTVATFLLHPVDTIVDTVKKDCLAPNTNKPEEKT